MSALADVAISGPIGGRAQWLSGLRWLVLTLIGLAILLGNRLMGTLLPTRPIWAVLAGVLLYNALFWWLTDRLARRGVSHRRLAGLLRMQIIADLIALTLLLHFSGGMENPFSLYYLLLIVIGSILLTRRDSYLFALIASFLWAGLLLAEGTGIVPHYNLAGFRLPIRHQEWNHIIAQIVVLTSAAFFVSYLSSTLIHRLRQNERELYETNLACELRAEELAELNERLQNVDHSRIMFIRLVTHELRAPVAAIQSYLRLILEGYVPAERMEEIVTKAEQRASDQLALISDLLDLARLREGQPADDVELCDAAAILEDVLDLMQARIENRQLEKHVQIEPELPLARARAEHVKQIWTNLISNAIKYTPRGGKVCVTLGMHHDMLRGIVRDTGIGIAPEDQERIFEEFFRTERAKGTARQGTGLGLSIVKGLVERYGGEIRVESVLDQGTTFTFTLPTISEDHAEPLTASEHTASAV